MLQLKNIVFLNRTNLIKARCVQAEKRKMIKKLGYIFLIIIVSCQPKNKTDNSSTIDKPEKNLFDNYSNDSIRKQIFKSSYENNSTAPNYIVFKATDLNTGLTKEICCEAPFLSGAIHREFNIKYDSIGIKKVDSIILANRQRIFNFKNKETLKNINFYDYPDYEKIIERAKQIDLEYYYKTFGKNDSVNSMHFSSDKRIEQVTFAHILFNCGIKTTRDCVAGNNIWIGN
ncbi:hypothetical protein [Lutibacter sp. HS1-25]|uniref:hypothetical protein n=1 Tax=Lutibacter sp. HS1-25 TaxID=2485000 RepID=UPI0010120CF7|nr:hypothetical protein [Lutibacter sp. HS1-25]